MTEYIFTDDYHSELQYYIDKLYDTDTPHTTTHERVQRVSTLLADYDAHTMLNGAYDPTPPASALSRMGTYLLREEMDDPDSGKVRKVEYNFHSPRQERRREDREKLIPEVSVDLFSLRSGSRTVLVKNDETGIAESIQLRIHPHSTPNTNIPFAF